MTLHERWRTHDAALSRRKHGFDSRRARHLYLPAASHEIPAAVTRHGLDVIGVPRSPVRLPLSRMTVREELSSMAYVIAGAAKQSSLAAPRGLLRYFQVLVLPIARLHRCARKDWTEGPRTVNFFTHSSAGTSGSRLRNSGCCREGISSRAPLQELSIAAGICLDRPWTGTGFGQRGSHEDLDRG